MGLNLTETAAPNERVPRLLQANLPLVSAQTSSRYPTAGFSRRCYVGRAFMPGRYIGKSLSQLRGLRACPAPGQPHRVAPTQKQLGEDLR